MKERFVLLVVVIVSIGMAYLMPLPEKQLDSFDERQYPYDQYFQQRAYPDFDTPFDAYLNMLQDVKNDQEKESYAAFDGIWEVQGPGNLGSRINTIASPEGSPHIIYVGFAGGGVWKTENSGTDWYPIFDHEIVQAIGDIAIDPNDANVVYVGTGDPNITSYPAYGNGLYKSSNGGQTWTNIGLSETGIISKVIINPNNTNQLFVSTMGKPYERNVDRGLYRSDDGGSSWQQVLFVSDQTGVIDMVMDPSNPLTLYAAGWDRIRTNSESVAYGPNAKIFKTIDGGNNWTQLVSGLPIGDQSRVGLAISPSSPNVVYAVYVGTDYDVEGVYKSIDGGMNWAKTTSEGLYQPFGNFGWYFGKIRVHPTDSDLLFLLGVYAWQSDDAGESWYRHNLSPVHPDKHDLIYYENGLLLATDGGLYRSSTPSDNWVDMEDIPTTQFYRVAYNPHLPDWYYGGSQDNGSSRGTDGPLGWDIYYGGDGFQTVFHPTDPSIFFAEAQYGAIGKTQNGGQSWSSMTNGIPSNDRKNWDMPYIISRHNPDILYAGTHHIYQYNPSTNAFESISSDLTDGNVYGAGFHTITSIDESFFEPGKLIVGTSDGNVWKRTIMSGWYPIFDDLPNRYVTSVKMSPANASVYYVTHSGYRDGVSISHVHRSGDNGLSWEAIVGDLPNVAVNDIIIIPGFLDSVLVVATDVGVYATVDAGLSWKRVGNNMPFVKVMDLDYNVANHEIIAGTFGRSIMTFSVDSLVDDGERLLAGTTTTATGAPIAQVEYQITRIPNAHHVADSFYHVGQAGAAYLIEPKKNDDTPVGINVLDLLYVYQYILGQRAFNFYEEVAADVNRDGLINSADLVLLRSLTLHKTNQFPNSQSWTFFNASSGVMTQTNTFGQGEAMLIDSLDNNMDSLLFIGVKKGDLSD